MIRLPLLCWLTRTTLDIFGDYYTLLFNFVRETFGELFLLITEGFVFILSSKRYGVKLDSPFSGDLFKF
jgi:hypothetical protein